MPTRRLKVGDDEKIMSLYLKGLCAQEIKDELKLPISVRQVQRRLKAMGVIRPVGDAFRNAVKRKRVRFYRKTEIYKRLFIPARLRYKILERDNFRCQTCGDTANESVLSIDHIDFDIRNNAESNLQVLCEVCNVGKSQLNNPHRKGSEKLNRAFTK